MLPLQKKKKCLTPSLLRVLFRNRIPALLFRFEQMVFARLFFLLPYNYAYGISIIENAANESRKSYRRFSNYTIGTQSQLVVGPYVIGENILSQKVLSTLSSRRRRRT